MNENLRWMLILGCLMLAALEAPRTSMLVAEDLAGPYSGAILAGGLVRAAGAESARLERLDSQRVRVRELDTKVIDAIQAPRAGRLPVPP